MTETAHALLGFFLYPSRSCYISRSSKRKECLTPLSSVHHRYYPWALQNADRWRLNTPLAAYLSMFLSEISFSSNETPLWLIRQSPESLVTCVYSLSTDSLPGSPSLLWTKYLETSSYIRKSKGKQLPLEFPERLTGSNRLYSAQKICYNDSKDKGK